MILVLSKLHIQRMHVYFGRLNIAIFVSLYTLSFSTNFDVVMSLFVDSFFLFLVNLFCIGILYHFK